MTHRLRSRTDGQALVLVALVLAVLVTLVVGVNEVAFRRRTHARIQDSLDQAAAAAVVQLDTTSLVADTPRLLREQAEAQFRARLRSGLTRVAAAVTPDPATLAQQAQLTVVAAGEQCDGRSVSAPAVCARLTFTPLSVLGAPQITLTTLAQAARQP
jgi:Flp pilus assembly protein TadG